MTSATPARGLFIVLEGLDRSGKTTQVARLEQSIKAQGKTCRVQKFPDRTTAIGGMIDAYLQQKTEMDDRAIHLLFSANRWECAKAIERDLQQGMTVIADRYAFSGIAFSAAKGLPFDWLLSPDIDLPAPDLTLFLSLAPSSASARSDYGSERYEHVEIQSRVREEFIKIGKHVNAFEGRSSGRWVGVDAEGTIEQVGERIWDEVRKVQEEVVIEGEQGHAKPVGRLWR